MKVTHGTCRRFIFRESHLDNDISGEFQTAPGIYYEIDGKDTVPVMITSTDS